MSRATLVDDLWQNDVRELRRLRAENRALAKEAKSLRHSISDALDGLPADCAPAEILRDALAPTRAAKHRGRKT